MQEVSDVLDRAEKALDNTKDFFALKKRYTIN